MASVAARVDTASPEPVRAHIHDLRNLFAVIASAKFLLERPIDEMKKALVVDALGRVAAEGRILTDGLLSRAAGRNASTIDAAREMQDLAPILGVLERPGAKIHLSCSDESCRVSMTAPEFAAAAVELVTNAMRAGASAITIRAAPRGRSYWLVVADNGCGFNAPSSHADPAGLHGTGLPRVASAAARAGGTIKIWSRLTRGSVVAMIMPLRPMH